jgi:hypothetical protein
MSSRVRVTLLLVAASALAVAGAWLLRGDKRKAPGPISDDPRYYNTPFRNVRPEVQAVGSDKCAGCHVAIATSYAKHPMGRAFASLAATLEEVRYDAAAHNPFEKFGATFQVERRDSRIKHTVRRSAAGKTLYEVAGEPKFVMGSGSHGRGYLVDFDGFLYQSPISWYSQKQVWDLAPGYNSLDMLFDRPIHVQCLYCHCNDARPVAHTINRFQIPLAREYAIGCERCHGPGELHVHEREADLAYDGPADTSIVNPAKLEPALRDAVCEQCHLQGEARILRRGRDVFDYRPGLPLHLFWSVYLRVPELRDPKAVSQVEQMRSSKCYLATQGRLGCIGCHDPHALPSADEKTVFYRQRCQNCHGQPASKTCSAPLDARRQKEDACHACHMPRLHVGDVAHTAMSDHRILRVPQVEEPARKVRPRASSEIPLVYYYRHLVENDDDEIRRDLGVALAHLAERGQRVPHATERLALAALPLLDPAVEQTPSDLPTREARGYALWLQDRSAKALEDFEAILAIAPERERSLVPAAYITADLDRLDASVAYWQRIVALNPWNTNYYTDQARVLVRARHLLDAIKACRAALRVNPANLKARQLLIEALKRNGDEKGARSEFETLLAAAPLERAEELRRWYAER